MEEAPKAKGLKERVALVTGIGDGEATEEVSKREPPLEGPVAVLVEGVLIGEGGAAIKLEGAGDEWAICVSDTGERVLVGHAEKMDQRNYQPRHKQAKRSMSLASPKHFHLSSIEPSSPHDGQTKTRVHCELFPPHSSQENWESEPKPAAFHPGSKEISLRASMSFFCCFASFRCSFFRSESLLCLATFFALDSSSFASSCLFVALTIRLRSLFLWRFVSHIR